MATLQEYKDMIFKAHPELLEQSLKADIDAAKAHLEQVQSHIAELEALESELTPSTEVNPDTDGTAAEEATETAQQEQAEG